MPIFADSCKKKSVTVARFLQRSRKECHINHTHPLSFHQVVLGILVCAPCPRSTFAHATLISTFLTNTKMYLSWKFGEDRDSTFLNNWDSDSRLCSYKSPTRMQRHGHGNILENCKKKSGNISKRTILFKIVLKRPKSDIRKNSFGHRVIDTWNGPDNSTAL